MSAEDGVTLIELVIYMLTSAVVMTAIVGFLIVTFRQQNDISSKTTAKNRAEQGFQQLVNDLEAADTDPTISSSAGTTTLSFQLPTPGSGATQSQVTWTCTGSMTTVGTCTRVLVNLITATTATRTEIVGVESLTPTAYNVSSPPTAITLPTNGTTIVSAVALALSVQDSSYGQGAVNNGAAKAIGGSTPIVLGAIADLRNES
jgi:galactokinase/mevalonate kinase-like predicted kinase